MFKTLADKSSTLQTLNAGSLEQFERALCVRLASVLAESAALQLQSEHVHRERVALRSRKFDQSLARFRRNATRHLSIRHSRPANQTIDDGQLREAHQQSPLLIFGTMF